MKLRIAGIVDDSVVDGDGVRLTVFTQGCAHRCKGCHNPETQPMDGGHVIDTDDVLKQVSDNPLLTGVTFSGGEPFLQPEPLAEIAKAVHKRGLDVWSYSGYTLEELEAMPSAEILLDDIDVLVDGQFVEQERDLSLHFRGSRNQRVINMAATRKKGEPVLLYAD